MSAPTVLESMVVSNEQQLRCEHTGLAIPECCCRHCCEAQLRRYAPGLMPQRIAPLPPTAILHVSEQHPQFVDSPQRQSYSRVHSASTEYLGNTERRGWG